jgi:hypothetical protein
VRKRPVGTRTDIVHEHWQRLRDPLDVFRANDHVYRKPVDLFSRRGPADGKRNALGADDPVLRSVNAIRLDGPEAPAPPSAPS